jgi:Ser/Thr protein kinase RdoA (MazF antagonist)
MNQQEIANEFELGVIHTTNQLTGGKVNVSHDVITDHGRFVLQNLSDIFDDTIITDYRKVQRFLRTNGVAVPVLLQTPTGSYHITNTHGFWRVFEYIDNDEIYDTSPQIAFEAGKMLGTFHEVMKQCPFKPESKIPHFHDTQWYVQRLREVYANSLAMQEDTQAFEKIMELSHLHSITDDVSITLHGDPKYQNMLFKESKAIAILDLDTLMQGSPLLDIGDGLRSWAKRNDATFDPECFKQGIAGYKSATDCDYDVLDFKQAMQTITLELAARYLTDAFEGSYFTWDDKTYNSVYEHNLSRAKRTLKFLEDIE